MKVNLTYILDDKLIPDFYHEVLKYYGLAAKNTKNSSLFIIKNLLSSYQYEKATDSYFLKTNLHQHQLNSIDYANQTIEKLNKKLAKNYEEKLSEFHQEKEVNPESKLNNLNPIQK